LDGIKAKHIGRTYLSTSDDDRHLERQLLLELLNGGGQALTLLAALDVVVL
jgi:hypothetical protein